MKKITYSTQTFLSFAVWYVFLCNITIFTIITIVYFLNRF